MLTDIKLYAKEESIMFNLKQSILPAVIVAGIPLLLLGGCAGHESVKVVMNNDVSEYENEITDFSEVAQQSELSNALANDEGKEINIVEVSESDIKALESDSAADDKKIPKPSEIIIGFDLNKSTIAPEYGELLWQHAQFIKQNPNFILRLNGHTDNTGNKASNQRLSLERAKNVAKILVDFGVPESRIKSIGSASSTPLVDAVNLKENRRVELSYEDTQLVIN